MIDQVAIFLDVENLSGWLKIEGGEILLTRANELGNVIVRRAYGDFSLPSVNIRQRELNRLGFDLINVYHPVKGKNSADIQLVVDVMEYVIRIPELNWFVIATKDSDFLPLFRRLRELGKSVMAVASGSTINELFKHSCDRLIYIDIDDEILDIPNTSSRVTPTNNLHQEAKELLKKAMSQFADGVSLSQLKIVMIELDSSFNHNNLGFKQFSKFLKSVPDIVTLYQVNNTWQVKTKTNKKSSNSKSKNQLSLEAKELLKKAMSQFSEGVILSQLKGAMLKLDISFDEKKLGFNKFIKFLESMPEIVTLSKANKSCKVKLTKENNIAFSTSKNQPSQEIKELLRKTINQFSEGIIVSQLKAALLQYDSSFNEKNLGFKKFTKFLESVPEIVTLYQQKNIWYVKGNNNL